MSNYNDDILRIVSFCFVMKDWFIFNDYDHNLCMFFRNTLIKNNIMDSGPYTERRNAITMTVDTNTPEGR